jgi:ubiquinone/menaquinone biosynthesis C-methylase UbiE
MRLLDCGCGSSSITVGLATAVAPGEVVGIDLEVAQIKLARTQATQANLTNVRFEVADVYELPFPDASFDAVYCCAVLSHLRERDKALREIRRVLKLGGLIGVRNDDLDGYLIAPAEPLLMQAWTLFGQFVQHNGGNAWAAKHLRTWLREAGFVQVEMSAAYEAYGTPAATATWSDTIVAILADLEPRMIEAGLTNPATVERLIAAWQAWGKHPDAFLGRSWCEAVGWVA